MSNIPFDPQSHVSERIFRATTGIAEMPARNPHQPSVPFDQRSLRQDRPGDIASRSRPVRTSPKAMSPPLVLVAEDEAEMRALLVTALQRVGYRVQECKAGSDLLVDLIHYLSPKNSHQSIDLIISDNRMPGVTGLEVMELAEFESDFPPAILITAFGDEQFHAEALHRGAIAVFDKPFEIEVLLKKVREVLQWPR